MSNLDWPDLYERIRPHLELKGNGQPDHEGWVTARCIDNQNHRNGDQHFSMRVNMKSGGVSCMSQGCISGNLNNLAERLGIETHSGNGARPSTDQHMATVEDLARQRKLPIEVLSDFWGITARQCHRRCGFHSAGWDIPIDDPDAEGFRRMKAFQGKPKYHWELKGCPAKDLVYNLTRLDPETEDVFIAPGEVDTWTLHQAGLPVISFLAGEGAVPSKKAIAKLKERAPKLNIVRLPYDRDEAGQLGVHKLGDLLLAASLNVEIINLPDDLPADGDISNLWVSCSGDGEAFLRRLYDLDTEQLQTRSPQVEQWSEDSFRISMPALGGWTHFDFERVARRGRALETELTVSVALPGVSDDPYVTAINVMSASAREGLRRQLEQMHPDQPWTPLLNAAVSRLCAAFFDADASLDMALVEPRSLEQRYRVGTILPEGQPTIFFGDGSTDKTYMALVLALSVATGDELLGFPVIFDRVLVIDYETDAQSHRFRYDRLLPGFGLHWQERLIDYWPAKGRPFVDIADAVRRKVEKDHIGTLIIDSAGYACGGDPSDPEITLAYFNALASIGKTSLTLAHVPKDSDQDKPYGSVYWSNSARKTWNFKRIQDEGEDVIHIGMFNRKSNDGRRDKPLGFRLEFDGDSGPVTVKREDVRDVPELNKGLPLKQRILHLLGQGAMTVDELAEELGVDNPVTIRARLNELKTQVQHVPGPDGSTTMYWGLIARYQE